MKVGIKYCGGCNPRFDRVAAVNRLKTEFPKAEFVTASLYPDCDIVLVVCGCFAACADQTGLKAKEQIFPQNLQGGVAQPTLGFSPVKLILDF